MTKADLSLSGGSAQTEPFSVNQHLNEVLDVSMWTFREVLDGCRYVQERALEMWEEKEQDAAEKVEHIRTTLTVSGFL